MGSHAQSLRIGAKKQCDELLDVPNLNVQRRDPHSQQLRALVDFLGEDIGVMKKQILKQKRDDIIKADKLPSDTREDRDERKKVKKTIKEGLDKQEIAELEGAVQREKLRQRQMRLNPDDAPEDPLQEPDV